MKKHIVLIIFLVLPLVSAESASPVYNVIDLGTLPGASHSRAYSINNNGQIVGGGEASYCAILFDSTGSGNNIDLGTISGLQSQAYSISDNGQIVGWAQNAATLFDSTGAGDNIDLGTLPDLDSSIAYSINKNGQIVGFAISAWASIWGSKTRAVFFDPTGGGNNIDLGTLGGSDGYAFSINNNGQIVGMAQNTECIERATIFDYTDGGNNIDLGALPGYDYSAAWSNNDNGQIVGFASEAGIRLGRGFDYMFERAALFDSTGAGNNIDLGTLGGDLSKAQSINNYGQIVGWACNASREPRATLFDSTGGGNNTDLNTLIDPANGWTLRAANSINDNGWIVGYGINPNGKIRAFLLKPINTAPVAVAGPNQVVYVCADDEIADITLDGSGSYDDDNDVLSYYWSWVIDGNVFEANPDVSGTIQLPVGEHQIELIVDDGTDESEPNYCTITVVEPLRAKLFCIPPMLNTESRRGTITAMVCMPAEITPQDIDANEPLLFIPGEIESKRQFVFQRQKHGWSPDKSGWIIASFDKDDCMDNLSGGINRVKVLGRLCSGRCYYGNSIIYVFTPRPFRRL